VNEALKALRGAIDSFAGRHVVVVGDLILDEYCSQAGPDLAGSAGAHPALCRATGLLGGAANAVTTSTRSALA